MQEEIDSLSSSLSAETEAREQADTALSERISTVAGDLATEVANRTSEDESLQGNITAEATARANADTALGARVTAIEEKIPNQATAQNQLADKDFVNSSVATNTANYISNNGQPFTSLAALEAYSGTLTNNDYAFVVGTDQAGNTTYTRYKYVASTSSWAEEYVLNNSSFTANQWAAINSGITSGDVSKLAELADIQTIGTGLSLTNGELSATSTGPTVVQSTGTSTTDVMSQNATTSMIYRNGDTTKVQIGVGSSASGSNYPIAIGRATASGFANSIAIGQNAMATATGAIAIGGGDSVAGFNTAASAPGAIALGRGAKATQQGQMDIGSANDTSCGYNNSNYRLLSGLYDGQSAHDAATYGQVISYSAINGAGAPTATTEGRYVGQLYYDTTNEAMYFLKTIDTTTTPTTYTWESLGGGSSVNVVQTAGTSTTDVMSQNAVTSMVFADPIARQKVNIGANAYTGPSNVARTTAVGVGARATANRAVAVGDSAEATAPSSVAIGRSAYATTQGQFDIGDRYNEGYNNTAYRLLTGLYDPQSAHDAATKGYVDTAVASAGANEISSTDWSTLWQ